jgi:Fur family transcriptional regulator, ferric uptake regulator
MEERVKQVKQQISAHNYKLTPQREATVRVLLENKEGHLSAEDVYLLVKKKSPEIGLATVYRTLELLSDLRIIHKLNFGDGVTRYKFFSEGMENHHHHLICQNCGTVDEIIEDILGPNEDRIQKEYDFQIIDYRLIFHGICYRCKEEN